ncbi:hypothetical protein CKY10_21830 [Photorhabdus sp. HUG-39]|uniref:Uncharacterized protein n=1 Tax=Photorhabdus kayaii TaxID=230088 RepID=A0ABX0B563_9GAMM|nr:MULTISPECIES: hypothetical protein [Photorhabdus]MCC8375588.1 hypothetical protein [Photorhabdus bodei]MDB6366715.1 hypothetical protein [Photorhabdus bodei]NDL14302.1 hypothetical protein [Photorhabdus kayaii]NDL27819.1 hypothetical protein [Photorhabdus kayaii]RAX06667.1 hypothetical protein CKY10_21830 [Photorhabdus sp. HUG-39]
MNSNSVNKLRNLSYINLSADDALGKIEALASAAGYLFADDELSEIGFELLSIIQTIASEASRGK